LAGADLPDEIRRLYPGCIELGDPVLYANFVESLDGVVALEQGNSGPAISGRSEADRFLMSLLRSFAQCVLIGAGTLRADRGHRWTPGYIYPKGAEATAELRSRLGLDPEPLLVVLTASGDIDPAEPAVAGALVLTSSAAAGGLRRRLPGSARIVEYGENAGGEVIVDRLRAEGLTRVLTEGGPSLMGVLLGSGQLDQLFITLSPVLAGRTAGARRLGLVEGIELLPHAGRSARLMGVRRGGQHLFLRYALT
jgi:riboflavin biosynthesis pyrimidine reductase